MRPSDLTPQERIDVYRYMRAQGFSRLTIKVLMSYQPDGMDRLTVILGQGTPYDYQLMHDDKFRFSELERFVHESKASTD